MTVNYYVDGDVGDDLNAGTAEGAGNAFATINKALSVAVLTDRVWVKRRANDAYYDENAVFTANGNSTVLESIPGTVGRIDLIGYANTPGDGGKVLWTASGGTYLLDRFNTTDGYHHIANFVFDGGTTTQVRLSGDCMVKDCDFLNGGSASNAMLEFTGQSNTILRCRFISPRYRAVQAGNYLSVVGCIFRGTGPSTFSWISGPTYVGYYKNTFQNFQSAFSTRYISQYAFGFIGNSVDCGSVGNALTSLFDWTPNQITCMMDNAVDGVEKMPQVFNTASTFIYRNVINGLTDNRLINRTGGAFLDYPFMGCEEPIEADPLFNDPANYDLTLAANSPCIDAGVESPVAPSEAT